VGGAARQTSLLMVARRLRAEFALSLTQADPFPATNATWSPSTWNGLLAPQLKKLSYAKHSQFTQIGD
jgi:hypothetical protein